MSFYDELKEKYKPLQPFELKDLIKDDCAKTTIESKIDKLVKEKKVYKFARGIYYIPKYNKDLKMYIEITFDDVIKEKYISNDNDIYGFYSDHYLLNKYKFSTQVPTLFTIVTNKETNIKRQIELDGEKIILKKARTIITKDNIKVVEFLELLNCISIEEYKIEKENKYQRIKDILMKERILQKEIEKYIIYYPAKVAKRYFEVKNEII